MRSFSQIYIMAVFGVKYRLGLIKPPWREHLYAVIGQTLSDIEGVKPIKIGGVADHVHVLFSTRGAVPENEIIRHIKTESSLWVNKKRLVTGKFAWQDGSGRMSYSKSALDDVIRYIANQEEHHKRVSFRDEYESWLRNLGIDYCKFDLPEDPK